MRRNRKTSKTPLRQIQRRLFPLALMLICGSGDLFAHDSEEAADTEASQRISFGEHVRPILNRHCTSCHGGVKQAADISFSYKDQVVAPEGWIVEPGEPEESELIARITSDEPDEVMPPPEHGPPLAAKEIATLKRWISEGAAWESHWAYTRPASPAIPDVKNSTLVRDPIDAFIQRRLETESLLPSPAARPERWLRRVSLDLTGLPPTIEERKQFLTDIETSNNEAYARVVDRLLDSPQFGERWASVWLDQIRYADSKGMGIDARRNIWKYRDWVVDAFNQDMPYNQFTIKQIAGDLLPDRSVSDRIATAAHRLTQTNEEGGTDDEEFRVAAVLDRVNTTWQTWQGVTFSCIQCHSHPYDPIRHEEFYEFAAFFNNTRDCDLNEDWPVIKAPIDPSDYKAASALDRDIETLRNDLFEQELALLKKDSVWQPVSDLNASTNKSTQVVVETRDGHQQFHTVDTVSQNTDITLDASVPQQMEQLSAIRFTASPLSPKSAVTDSEWGFVLSHVEAFLIVDGKEEPQPIQLSHVIADESDPFLNPQESLNPKSNQGFAAYTRMHYPRQAALVLESPMEIPAGASLRVVLKHRYFILASFSLVTRRGHIEVSSSDQFQRLLRDPTRKKKQDRLADLKSKRRKIKSTPIPVLEEVDPRFSRPTNVFIRGLFLTKADQVSADTPDSLPPLPNEDDVVNRIDLANWLVSPENPLTARVAVNRIWAQLFGIGIVATEEDFGSSGELPSHPKLLDYLAVRFQNDLSWSTKKLLRQIVLSHTYRQRARTTADLLERDPQNRLLAAGPRFRLPSEVVRDQALAVSGLLNLKMAGPPVRPPIPDGVWNPFSGGDKWETAKPGSGDRYRRSIYTYTKRSIPYPMFAAFDAPSREFCTPRRLRSNTPLQALMTLNDQTFIESAAALAKRMRQSADDLAGQIEVGFLLTTCRSGRKEEIEELTELAKSADGNLDVVATVLLNLDEVLMK